ncbi:MAG TPA: DUF1634 domain-containing protein [Terriglobia bacterium]|nr:DUF1634 domain-containing protein [Terriglobia bacterium]
MVAIRRMEKLIGIVLLAGVLISAFIVLFGGVLYMWRHGSSPVHYRIFRGEPSDLRSLAGIWKDFEQGSGRGAIQFGLMLLVGVQLVRVALTGVLFLLNRDKIFVVITFLVLAMLTYALFFAGE